MASCAGCGKPGCYWLLEGEGHRRAEQLEGPALDGRGTGEFLDFLPSEDDGLPVEVVGLGDAEVPFDVFEVLVGGDRARSVEDVCGHAGADHVDPVEGGLGGNLLLVAAVGEPP